MKVEQNLFTIRSDVTNGDMTTIFIGQCWTFWLSVITKTRRIIAGNDITSRGYPIALSNKQTNGNVYQLLLQSYVFFKKNTFVKIFLILNQNFPILSVIFL